MADPKNRWHDNAMGRWYVDVQCIDCDLCNELAAAHFKGNDDENHSFVYKQPETAEELAACREAKRSCPVDAIGDDG